MDPLAEDFYSYSPYNYVGNNPVKRIDPDGQDWLDIVKGAVNAVLDNATGGLNNKRLSTPYSNASDYNLGQDIGDIASTIVGVYEKISGGTAAVGGAAGTIVTAGVGAPVTGTIMVSGVATAAHGAVNASSGASNLINQKGRVNEKGTYKSERELPRNSDGTSRADPEASGWPYATWEEKGP